MQMLSDDDTNLDGLSEEELALAWDLWFDLAQATNDDDPLYTHGVFQRARIPGGPPGPPPFGRKDGGGFDPAGSR